MKVLVTGDSPFISTGFGRVNEKAAAAFAASGFEVGVVSGLSMDPVEDSLGYTMFYPRQGDVLGTHRYPEAINEFEPDLIYHTGEPGMLTAFAHLTPARIPFLAYVPIEGEPIVKQDWRQVLSGLNIITCSEYGANIIERDCGRRPKWAYHGIDHDTFKVNGRRDEVREMLGWTDRFVLMSVAANVRRKQHPRLFEALSILKHHYKQKDMILYDHTIPFDGHWLEGWDLPEVAHAMKVHSEVVFNPEIKKHGDSIPDVGQFGGLGLVDLYNAADLFVLPSQVEGFGLPIAEAMACGLPVLVTKYAAGWEVARPAGYGIPAHDWETHKSGTRYANVEPLALAKEILHIKRDAPGRRKKSLAGLQRVRDFRWETFTETLIGESKAILAEASSKRIETVSDTPGPEDSGQDQSQRPSDATDTRDKIETKISAPETQAGSEQESQGIDSVSEQDEKSSSSTS